MKSRKYSSISSIIKWFFWVKSLHPVSCALMLICYIMKRIRLSLRGLGSYTNKTQSAVQGACFAVRGGSRALPTFVISFLPSSSTRNPPKHPRPVTYLVPWFQLTLSIQTKQHIHISLRLHDYLIFHNNFVIKRSILSSIFLGTVWGQGGSKNSFS